MARRADSLEAFWIDPEVPDFNDAPKQKPKAHRPGKDAPPEEAVFIVRDRIGFQYERRAGLADFVSQREAARLLGVSVMTVNRWVRDSDLSTETRNGYSVIKLSKLVRFAADRDLLDSKNIRTRVRIASRDEIEQDPEFSGFVSNLSSKEYLYVHFHKDKKPARGRSRKPSR